jgi:hypothetical protein
MCGFVDDPFAELRLFFLCCRLIEFIRVQYLSEVDGREVNSAWVVLIARFLQALCDLCPNLQKCFCLSQNSTNLKVSKVMEDVMKPTTEQK